MKVLDQAHMPVCECGHTLAEKAWQNRGQKRFPQHASLTT
jgi:hypothetical protein